MKCKNKEKAVTPDHQNQYALMKTSGEENQSSNPDKSLIMKTS